MNKKDKEVLLKEIEKNKSKHSLILDQSKPNLNFEGKYYNNIHHYNSTNSKEVPLLKKLNDKKTIREGCPSLIKCYLSISSNTFL